MFYRTYGAAFRGVDVQAVSLELRTGRGIQFHVAGMSASLARDAFLRIQGALHAQGWKWPRQSLTVSLHPGHATLHPADFDLPLALLVLASIEVIPTHAIETLCSAGTLGLDGLLHGHPSCSNASIAAELAGCDSTVVASSGCVLNGGGNTSKPIYGAQSLVEVVAHLNGKKRLPRRVTRQTSSLPPVEVPIEHIQCAEHHRNALLLSAAGEHHLLLVGSPGTGKSISAKAVHGLLPNLSAEAAVILQRMHAAKGLIREYPNHPPLRCPHASSGSAALIGSQAKGRYGSPAEGGFLPGELTLAHKGLLVLDELPEWSRAAIEALRLPLEQRRVDLARAHGTTRLPADTLVVATANPCPCGYFLEPGQRCRCTRAQVRNYLKRISGPILDRFPLHLETTTHPTTATTETEMGPWPLTTADARERVQEARKSRERGGCLGVNHAAKEFLNQAVKHWHLSERARIGISAVARTHALIHGKESVDELDVNVALGYRVFDRADWLENAWTSDRPRHMDNGN